MSLLQLVVTLLTVHEWHKTSRRKTWFSQLVLQFFTSSHPLQLLSAERNNSLCEVCHRTHRRVCVCVCVCNTWGTCVHFFWTNQEKCLWCWVFKWNGDRRFMFCFIYLFFCLLQPKLKHLCIVSAAVTLQLLRAFLTLCVWLNNVVTSTLDHLSQSKDFHTNSRFFLWYDVRLVAL